MVVQAGYSSTRETETGKTTNSRSWKPTWESVLKELKADSVFFKTDDCDFISTEIKQLNHFITSCKVIGNKVVEICFPIYLKKIVCEIFDLLDKVK